MPDMPAAFYAPCIGALVATIGILWRWGLGLQAQLLATSKTSVEALLAAATAIETNNTSVGVLRDELARLVQATSRDAATRSRRGEGPPR